MIPSLCIISVLIMTVPHLANGMHDADDRYTDGITGEIFYLDSRPVIEDEQPYFRTLRNIYESGRQLQRTGPRFAWQNPLSVAPTLPPRNNPTTPPYQVYPGTTPRYQVYPGTTPRYQVYPETTEHYNYATRGYHTAEPSPTYQPLTGSGKCPNGQKRDKLAKKCVKLGSSCGQNKAFYENPDDLGYAQCDCIQHANRPLVYHSGSRKCYFAFQQAYCSRLEWLVIDSRPNSVPRCDINRCREWISDLGKSKWDWTNNGPELDKSGPIGLLNERRCSMLGSFCTREGREQLMKIIVQDESIKDEDTGISLVFEGTNLVCTRGLRNASRSNEFVPNRNGQPNRELTLTCKRGLFNKWRLEGNCQK